MSFGTGLVYRDAHQAVQKAVYQRLKAMPNKKGEVYDLPPKGTSYPYYTVDEQQTGNDFSCKTLSGQDMTFVVAAWTDYAGNAEAQEMANQAVSWLTEWDWGLVQRDGFKVLNVSRIESRGIIQFDDRVKWIIRFRIFVVDTQTNQLNN